MSFERARQAGDFRVFACAMVCEPLTLTVELVTVVVIEAPMFDALFSKMVAVNEEGAAVSRSHLIAAGQSAATFLVEFSSCAASAVT